MIEFSANEFKALVTKAIWGAGYTYGMAQDAGMLALNMAHDRSEAAKLFCGLLNHKEKCDPAQLEKAADNELVFSGISACPLSLCCAIMDMTPAATSKKPLAIRLEGDVSDIAFFDAGLRAIALHIQRSIVLKTETDEQCFDCVLPSNKAKPQAQRIMAFEADIKTLESYATKTLAPESEALRLSGAGAGLTDND